MAVTCSGGGVSTVRAVRHCRAVMVRVVVVAIALPLTGGDPRPSYLFPSDFAMIARFSGWCASAVQLREMLFSTVAGELNLWDQLPVS